jgi:hypothetical protein
MQISYGNQEDFMTDLYIFFEKATPSGKDEVEKINQEFQKIIKNKNSTTWANTSK